MFKTKRDVDRHVTHILNKIRGEKEKLSRGFQFAKLYHDVGDNVAAKRHLQGFLSVQETVPHAHKLLGQIHESLREKQQALEAYKRSLDLSPDQNDLILKVCELYSDDDIAANKDTIEFWIDKAEKHFPDNLTIFKLKERLIDKDGGADWEELKNLISRELTKNPENVQMHMKLVCLLQRHRGVEPAYEHAIATEKTLAFVSCPDWYECLLQLFQAYEVEKDCKGDVAFQTFKLFAQTSLAFLKLRSEERDLTAAINVIHQLDQTVFECCWIQKQTDDWTGFLTEMKGQLLYLVGLLLLKRALKGQMQWRDAKSFSVLCFLLGEAMKPMDLKSRWFQQVPKDSHKFYERVQMLGYDRLSQGGHMIHELKMSESGWAAKLRQRLWTPQGREGLYSLLFTSNELKRKKTTSFLLQDDSLSNTSFQVPAREHLIMYDSVAFTLHTDNLNHLVWLALRYFKEDVQADYEQLFKYQLYPDLKFSSSDMSSGDPGSLSQLDVQSFFYACVKWTSLDQRERKRSLHSITDKPNLLPVCLTTSLCPRPQSEWWSAVYKMEATNGSYKLSQVWGVVMRGLETIRLVSPHMLSLPMVVMLARNMDKRVHEMESLRANIVTPKLTALQARAAFYWGAAQDILDKQERNIPVKQPKEMLFPDNCGSNPAQTKELREQIRFALAQIDMREERYEDALKGFEGLGMAEASFFSGQIYRTMAVNLNTNDNSSDDTQMMLLTKAKNSLYQALDRLKSGNNRDLEHQIKQELDDVVCKLISLESGGSLVDSFLSEKSVHDSLTDCKGRDEEDAIGRQPNFYPQVLSTPTRVREPHCISPTRIDVQMRALETTNTALCARLATLEETVRSNVKTIQEVFSQLREAREEIKSLRNELQVVAFQGLTTMSGMAMPRAPVPQPFPGTPQTRGLINTMNTSYGAGITYDFGAQGAAAIPPHMAQYGYPVTGNSPRPGSAFGPHNYEEDFNNMDGEYYDPDNDYDQNLVQEWPFGHKAAAEGKSTITYSPHQQGVTPGVHQSGVANPAANSGMFANALRGPSLQYGNFQQPATSLPMPAPGFFSQPSPVVQPPAVPAQSGLFPSPGQMGAKPGINQASQSKPVTPTMPQASAGKSTPIMPPNAVASQSMESKPKLIASSVGITTPKNDQDVVQLMPNAGGFLAAHGQVSPGSAAATLSQLAAKHQESSKSPVAPAANTVTTTPQKTVFGGFTFTSTPKITDPKKSEAAQKTSTATFIPKPFSGFSLSAPMSKTASTGPGAFTVSPSARKQNLSTCSDDHIDEYEPNVDFKPVVPLPELIEVKTGEEDEDRMFCERAKLFRFDPETKQWKERGLGEMKILKHKQTKEVRILMRREQVLKLCANHRLTKEMKLMPMASLDKAWVWEAMDFSEEEMKYERLACKFKTADIASKFKEAFEACQKEMSSDSTGQVKKVEENTKPKDQHATPKDQQTTSSKPDLSTMFKSKPGSWTCDGCFIKNNAEILECPCCKTLKPGVKKEDVKPASTPSVQPTFGSSAKPAGTAFTFGGTSSSTGAFKFGAPAAGSLPGSEQGKVPIFGGQPGAASSSGKGFTFTPSTLAAATTAGSTSTGFKFASPSATTSSSIFGATTTTTASSSSGGFVFGSPAAGSGAFQFGTTQGQNAQSTSIFPAASTAGEAPKSTPFNLPQPCKPSSGITFGTSSANSTTASESGSGQSLLAKVLSEESPLTKGFPFSPAKSLFTTTDPATSKPMFGVASTLGAANKSDFTFGNNPSLGAATTSSTTKSSGFTFSMSMTPTKTTSPVKSSEGFKSPTSPGVNEEGYYVNKEEEDSHIHFEPIIKLPDKVEVVTGEEDEEVLFVHRAKLFRLVNKEWKERGLGEMKILYNNQTKKARLLMRREQILKMCCNHYISPEVKFTHMPNSKGCVLVWFAIDFSEESEGTSEQLSIKFKTPEVVAKFLEGIAEARRRCAGGVETIGAAGKSPIKAAADNGDDDDDDDVIFVKEEKASAEEIQKAREFMLPDNFFLYLKCKPCPGCRGCEDRMPEEDAPRSSGSKGNWPVTESADDKKMEQVVEEEDKKKDEEEEEEEEEEEDEEEEEEDETEEYESDTEDVEKSSGMFGMGSSQPTFGDMQATGSSEFVFGSSSAGFSFSDFARKDPNAFKSSEGKPFLWQGAGAQLFGGGGAGGGGSAGDDGEGGDDDATEQGNEPQFEPVIALPDLVEVKTGEEDETVEYAQRSKLFRFDVQANQWKEKGIGEMKILKHKDQCRYRLLMRREQVHKLACNHLLTPDMVLTPLPTSETSWCWTAQDYAENEAKIENFAIKFKTIDLAHEFKKRVEECQAKLRQQPIGQNESGESLMSQLLLDETG